MTRIAPFFLVAALLASPVRAADYVQAPGSALTFSSKYQGEQFTGRFPSFTTRLRFDPKSLATSRLDVTIQLAGVSTANAERDGYLKGADFLHSAKHRQARFVATRFRALGGTRYAADGTLSLRGVSRPVTLVFTWTPGERPVLAGQATLKRLEFGVGSGDWADTSLIPNDVSVATRVVFAPGK